uniref:Uncharacterized protein n=1 Tax=Cyprinus carpio TaxID=7962 RepID=A0A8C1HWT1_CYPCA
MMSSSIFNIFLSLTYCVNREGGDKRREEEGEDNRENNLAVDRMSKRRFLAFFITMMKHLSLNKIHRVTMLCNYDDNDKKLGKT